jgi:hypothetical protein
LNRRWKNPSLILNPTIFWSKLVWRFLIRLSGHPVLICDFHGHSRKKNVFIFGNENPPSSEFDGVEKVSYLTKRFPQILSAKNHMFDFSSCRFNIEASKESTARVVMYREFGILNSFTLESTYCGFDIAEKRVVYLIRDCRLSRVIWLG